MNPVTKWNLTPREEQVMRGICEHGDAQAVAEKLGVKPVTVVAHTQSIYRKAGCSDRVLVSLAWDRAHRSVYEILLANLAH